MTEITATVETALAFIDLGQDASDYYNSVEAHTGVDQTSTANDDIERALLYLIGCIRNGNDIELLKRRLLQQIDEIYRGYRDWDERERRAARPDEQIRILSTMLRNVLRDAGRYRQELEAPRQRPAQKTATTP